MSVDLGFDYRNVIAIDVSVPIAPGKDTRAAIDEASRRGHHYIEQMIQAVARVPGVERVGAVQGGVPLTNAWTRAGVSLPGRGELKGDERSIDRRITTPNYLQVMRVPLVRGRYLSEHDRENTEQVVVINQYAARKYWPGQDAVGQRIKIGDKDRLVVGIMGDIRHMGPESPVRQEACLPLAQQRTTGATLVVRTNGNPSKILPAVKSAIWSVNRQHRFYGETFTLEGYMDRFIAQRRFNMALLALFGLLGLVIAAAGIYGVMAYVVAQRTNEIGVRMALGAGRHSVVSMVLRRASLLILAGLAVGGVGTCFLTSSVRAFLFEVQPNDIRIFLGALAIMAISGLAASVVPARRAASVDPLVSLRCE
jgi:predicted permease